MDSEPAEERRRSPRGHVRARMDAGALPVVPLWTRRSEDSDGEESECEPRGARAHTVSVVEVVSPAASERYVRLQEEHIEPSVVVLTNGGSASGGADAHGCTAGASEPSPKVTGGKLTFNLTPEQLGVRVSGGPKRANRAGRSASVPIDVPPLPLRPEKSPVEGGSRKSSLRRTSVYSNQSEVDRQLHSQELEEPPGGAESLPSCCDGPRNLAAGLQPQLLLALAAGEDGQTSRASPSLEHRSGRRSRSTSANKFDEISTVYDHFPTDFLPDKYLCGLCRKLLREPRVLECLHTFCRACLVRVASSATHGQDSALFWSRLNESANFDWDPVQGGSTAAKGAAEDSSRASLNSNVEPTAFTAVAGGESRFDQLRTSFQSHCLRSPGRKGEKEKEEEEEEEGEEEEDKVKARVMCGDRDKVLACPTCNQPSALPAGPGGVSQLPQHSVLARKIETIIFQHGTPSVSICSSHHGSPAGCSPSVGALCELCFGEVKATGSCQTCSLRLCSFCQEAHQRQRSTASHGIVRLVEPWSLRCGRSAPARSRSEASRSDESIKCPMHPEQQLKLFCTTCHQVICGECSTLVHREHRCTTVARAAKVYGRFVRSAIEQTRPLEDYALQQVGRLNDLTVRVNSRCEAVQREVDAFVDEYVAALEEHRRTLTEQIGNIRQAKTEMIMAQKLDVERRSQNARAAIEFAEELMAEGNDVENLVFVSMLLRRFEQCLKPSRSIDRTVTETVQFLADEEAPSARLQTGVPLFGVVTTQSADPRQSGIEPSVGELAGLKAHRRVQLRLVVRDHEGRRLAHGGITVQTDLRFRDDEDHSVAVCVVDNRDGSYGLSFVPPRAGVMHLTVSVDGKTMEECPIALRIHKLRPHHGVYHCCTFCSSSGSKVSTCACGGIMPGGYRGCGHGHEGHPGQRHWSCCGSLLEHSDCTATGGRQGRRTTTTTTHE